MKKKLLYAIIAILLTAAVAYFVLPKISSQPEKNGPVNTTAELAACGSYPNGSSQSVTETSRLTIKLPKGLYPNQGGFLPFKTASGTATAGWISNAGPAGESYGATADCFAYYYEFDGAGEVDLRATSSIAGVPDYTVRFLVTAQDTNGTITYRNDQYGFTFTLPADWKGYTIATDIWTGYVTCPSGQCPVATGTEIMIRNPQWTPQNNWQPIPIEVFTTAEWDDIASGTLITSAAPIPPAKLGANAKYVFALPPRYDYAFPKGWQEVESIMQSHPLRAF